jgi:predicted DNA-binding transcriptional regulator AlpA
MRILIHYEARTQLTDDQAAEILVRGGEQVVMLRLTDAADHRAMRLTLVASGDDPTAVTGRARTVYQRLIDGLPVEEPYRVMAEREDAPQSHGLVSTRTIAARLGVSDARVRQLSTRPDFPKPVPIPGLAGDVYKAEEITDWARSWDREAKGGRPRSDR